jgi:hypothetical protein
MKPTIEHYSRIAPIEKSFETPTVDVSSTKRVESQPPSSTLVSLSHDATHFICATKTKFYCLKVDSGQYQLVGWGTGWDDSK